MIHVGKGISASVLVFMAAQSASAVTPPPPPPPRAASFEISTSAVATVTDNQFLSFGFDPALMGERMGDFFVNQRVPTLLAGLAPAYFRFSGTDIDHMLWDEHATCDNRNSSAMCINATQLASMLRVVSAAGLDLVLGLNGKVGKSAAAPNAPWDSTNAQQELTWLAEKIDADPTLRPPFGYELGNEPDLWPWTIVTPAGKTHVVNGSQLAADAATLRSVVGSHAALRPNASVTFGPDTCNCYNGDVVLQEYSAATVATTGLATSAHKYTWHFYNSGAPKSAYDMTSVAKADLLITKIKQAFSEITGDIKGGTHHSSNVSVVIGETGECAMGGW